MDKIKENLETFLIIWGVILVLNQAVIFGGCFAPYCILAALPHTGFIALILSIFILKDENNKQEKSTILQDTREKLPPGFWSKTGHHLRTNAYYPSFDFDENGWSKYPVYLKKTKRNEYVHLDTGDRVNDDGKTRQQVIYEKEELERIVEKKEVKPIQENIDRQETQQSELNQLYIKYLDLVKQYHQLSTQKIKIVQTINNYEKNKFDIIGEITLKILALRQNDSFKSMEEYKTFLTQYEAYKHKKYQIDSSVEKFDINFVSNIPAINNKIKDIQFKITMLQKELKVLKDKDLYKLAKSLDPKSHFEKEKQKLQLELDALEAQKKPLKKVTVQVNIDGKSITIKETKTGIYEDKELSELKLQLKSFESRLQELIEQKTEYLNDLDEFNRAYNLHLGDIIKTILKLRKEILYKKTIKQQKLKAKYQEDLKTFEETEATIDELKNTIDELKSALDQIDEHHEDYDELLSAYDELNGELSKLEQELDKQESELKKTKESLDDDEVFQQYEEAKSTFDDFDESYQHIKAIQKQKIELGDEEKAKLKNLFRKAARLCHPDIVPDELKDQATQIMQQLNAAYDKQDLAGVKKILESLENGRGFEVSSDRINNKEQLKEKIKEYKANIANIESEIEEILQDETYQTITTLDDWDAYFDDLKNDLEAEKQKLEEENDMLSPKETTSDANKAIEDNKTYSQLSMLFHDENSLFKNEDPWVVNSSNDKNNKNNAKVKKTSLSEQTKASEKAIEKIKPESSPYATHIKSIEVPNFEKIRRYCNNLADENKADAMQIYLAENGRMHKALMYDTLEQFIEQLNGKEITLVDWGCSQGIASMLVLDYIREKQLSINVKQVTLIDDDVKAMSRAMVQIEALKQTNVTIEALEAKKDNVTERIKSIQTMSIHLFANDKIPVDLSTIKLGGYVVCLSHENTNTIDKVCSSTKGKEISNRDNKIGRFRRFERIVKL